MPDPLAEFDRSDLQILKVTFTGESPSDENFQEYLDELLLNYQKKTEFVILFDATVARFPPAKFQKQQADWMKKHKDLIKLYCKGVAYKIPSKLIREALKLIFKFQPQPIPYKVFAENEKAMHWLKGQLSE